MFGHHLLPGLPWGLKGDSLIFDGCFPRRISVVLFFGSVRPVLVFSPCPTFLPLAQLTLLDEYDISGFIFDPEVRELPNKQS